MDKIHNGQNRMARLSSDRGASLVEYALLVALIAVVCIVAVAFFGTETSDSFSRTASTINGAA